MDRIDHIEEGLSLLPSHLRTPRVEGLIRGLLACAQPLEETLIILELRFVLDNNTGWLLDYVGKLLNYPRNGNDDDTYRRYLKAVLATYRSKGRAEDLITIASLVISDPAMLIKVKTETLAVSHVYTLNEPIDAATATVLIDLLKRGVASGVRLIVDYAYSPSAALFRFDSGPGFDQGHFAGAA